MEPVFWTALPLSCLFPYLLLAGDSLVCGVHLVLSADPRSDLSGCSASCILQRHGDIRRESYSRCPGIGLRVVAHGNDEPRGRDNLLAWRIATNPFGNASRKNVVRLPFSRRVPTFHGSGSGRASIAWQPCAESLPAARAKYGSRSSVSRTRLRDGPPGAPVAAPPRSKGEYRRNHWCEITSCSGGASPALPYRH